MGRSALVGRADELAEMLRVCRSGPGGVTLLTGDAGSGKTRLLGEACGQAGLAGAMALRGHAVPAGGPSCPPRCTRSRSHSIPPVAAGRRPRPLECAANLRSAPDTYRNGVGSEKRTHVAIPLCVD